MASTCWWTWPATVQVEYMLGHGYTSGLSAMDAFLADDRLAPPGAEALFSERLIRLPRIPLAYRAPEGMPAVASSLAGGAGDGGAGGGAGGGAPSTGNGRSPIVMAGEGPPS